MSEEIKQDHRHPLNFAKSVLRVIYSPMKAFKEIAKKPSIKGPILILLLTLPFVIVIQYSSTSKFFLETPMPENDLWTEESHTSQSFSWNSSNEILYDSDDQISGNYSIFTTLFNESQIWLKLAEVGSINCSINEYNRLTFGIKVTNQKPSTTLLQLLSGDGDEGGFELDISPLIETIDEWTNITVDLATDEWVKTNSIASWANINGLGYRLIWANSYNLTVKIDGLFFGKYESSAASYGVDLQFISILRSSIDFLVEWLILSGIVLLILRSFSSWVGTFKDLMYYIGHVYSASIVYLGAIALMSLFLPSLYIPANITFQEYVQIYQTSWGAPISYITLAYYGWATILCAISLKELVEMSWSKAILAGFGAFIMSVLFSSFLLSAFF